MVRDDLEIPVPSYFRCPISLDVMKSPVSVCTGVTYDRSSIQRWLDNGNNTCPATMQVLQTKDLVPNRTLHRLIQNWCHRLDSSDSPRRDLDFVLSDQQVQELVQNKLIRPSDANCCDVLSKLASFAGESADRRKFLAKVNGLVPILLDLLGACSVNVSLIEQAAIVLHLVAVEMEDKEQLMRWVLKNGDRDCIAPLLFLLQRGRLESQIASARILESIAINAESKLSIASREGLLAELVKLLAPEKDPQLIESALSCLISISMSKRVKINLVHLGAIKALTKLLLLTEPSSSAVTERALKLLETASSVREGQWEICEDEACVGAIVDKVLKLKVSRAAIEHAVTILWSVCYLFRDERAKEAVVKANGPTKILLLLQSNCSPSVRQMATDLLKVFRVNSKSCLSSYNTNTTHITPC